MAKKLLFSTAYLPPAFYFAPVKEEDEIIIEKEENYLKQTYRNRCYILSSHGIQMLTVPVYDGSLHKVHVKEIRIDYSKRWQQVHLRAMVASYNSSPYFEFYFDQFEAIISSNQIFLIDLNTQITELVLKILGHKSKICFTTYYENQGVVQNDFRYIFSPKKPAPFKVENYQKVFESEGNNLQHLSIADLIFNTGPEAGRYLRGK
jgi:hypothetical protein